MKNFIENIYKSSLIIFLKVKEMPKNYNFHLFKLFIISSINIIILSNKIYSQSLSAEKIYEKVKDAVVVILAYDYSDELAAHGSGVVINDKGYVVTNYHILSGNDRLEIMHGDDEIPYVDIIGIDVEKDILILKIEEKKFPSVKTGDIKKLKVGQRVYAIGSPMGFENTISEGIISGLRSYDEQSKNYIQVTASISPGSSGGAVVNDKCELIGISTLTVSDGQNLNFAIPIDEVLNVEIGSYGENNSFTVFELFRKGLNSTKVGKYKDAIDYYSQFIKTHPYHSNAYLNRGHAKAELGDFIGAIEDFNKSLEINPRDAGAYTKRGSVKCDLNDYYGAIKDLNTAIEIDPLFSTAFLNRAYAKYKLSDYRGSIKDCNEVININPNDYKAYFNRGTSKNKLEDYRGAIQDFNIAIGLNPFDERVYFNRGISKFELGDTYGACLDWSKSGELGNYDAYEVINDYCN